jgi:hypothetical protein
VRLSSFSCLADTQAPPRPAETENLVGRSCKRAVSLPDREEFTI